MIVREIVATCTNPHVARAAIDCIGGEFACRLSRQAESRNLSRGSLAAQLLRQFATRAEENDWDGVWAATRGSEMPVLSGLRFLLERACELDDGADSERDDFAVYGDWSRARDAYRRPRPA